MCLSAFVSNSLSLLLFTLQKYIQYSLHHQWCKKIKVTIHPRKIHMFHPKKGTVPYSNRKSHLPFQTSHFLGLGSKNPRPFIFQPKKILHSDETTKRTHRFPEAKATRKVSPTPRYTFWRKGKACQVQMARVHVGKPPWKPPSTWAFLQGSRIRYGGGTHGNGIHTPEPSKGDRKTEWISEEMGKAMRCFTFWGGGGGRESSTFLFGFLWFLWFLGDFLRKIGMGDMSVFLVNMNRMLFFLSFVVEPLRINPWNASVLVFFTWFAICYFHLGWCLTR